jgi:hypothetical protein
MGRHDPRIGGRDGFRADEILADPGQTLPPERRNILPADRLDADIAGFGDQRCAEAGFEMLYPGLPLTEMREGFGEAGALHDFQEEIGHAGLWHSSLNGGAQCGRLSVSSSRSSGVTTMRVLPFTVSKRRSGLLAARSATAR